MITNLTLTGLRGGMVCAGRAGGENLLIGKPMPSLTKGRLFDVRAARTTRNIKAGRIARLTFRHLAALALVCLSLPLAARADTISGTVKDPSGAVVAGARVEITGGTLTQSLVLQSDEVGKFSAPNLPAGKYTVRTTKEGFDAIITPVELAGTAELQLKLTIASQVTRVDVTDKNSSFANSDSVYRQLRTEGLGDTYRCESFKLPIDAGTFELKSGTITFLQPINGEITGAVFVGQGHFTLKTFDRLDVQEMIRRSGSPAAEEDLKDAVFRFSDGLYARFSGLVTPTNKVSTPAEAATVYQHWQHKVRQRQEVAESFTQAILQDETIDNVDADVMSAIYNPKHPQFFNVYMSGAPHKDLRFFIRTRVGAIPQLDSSEEVALINFNPGGMDDGVWYSQHLLGELKAHTANSQEDRRLFATHKYKIETVIGKNNHLFARATLTFEPLIPGERVLKFGLLPTLRVTRVTDERGQELHFIQEDRKDDGSFYTVLDAAPEMGKEHAISIEYAGDKVLTDAGAGSYYIGSRTSWYPNLNGFGEKALYDLTFKVPHSNVLISVGKLESESTEAGFAVTHWVTPVPIAVAGFNYGQYKKIDFPDDITHYILAGYYLTELPDRLVGRDGLASMSPGAMTKYALDQTRAQMQLCTMYFGKAPYENIEITEQPNFNFGQSWPGLVYLPISAYIDSTQRWMLFGGINSNFTGFVQEVTPHEVAHQWFGHAVTWASYHDQWLSEGFAEFSAGLFLQHAVGGKWQKDYLDFWERQRTRILEKNNFGIAPTDAGPLWMGLRLISPRSPAAYQSITYPKGAYVLQMLRSLMYNDGGSGNRDQAFIDMMHDFVETHRTIAASTESFKAVAEKHMTARMDLQQNKRLDWFFNEWVYGTKVPRYQFKYTVQPAVAGVVKVQIEVTQSEVDENFAMLVPVFADFGKGMMRVGQVGMIGNATRTVTFDMDQAPKKVELNAYKDILAR
ncbi:MAG TPA: M1 family aminopeptidase [Candidatus Acidoferrum sp.]|jgi:hypothetical protein